MHKDLHFLTSSLKLSLYFFFCKSGLLAAKMERRETAEREKEREKGGRIGLSIMLSVRCSFSLSKEYRVFLKGAARCSKDESDKWLLFFIQRAQWSPQGCSVWVGVCGGGRGEKECVYEVEKVSQCACLKMCAKLRLVWRPADVFVTFWHYNLLWGFFCFVFSWLLLSTLLNHWLGKVM